MAPNGDQMGDKGTQWGIRAPNGVSGTQWDTMGDKGTQRGQWHPMGTQEGPTGVMGGGGDLGVDKSVSVGSVWDLSDLPGLYGEAGGCMGSWRPSGGSLGY